MRHITVLWDCYGLFCLYKFYLTRYYSQTMFYTVNWREFFSFSLAVVKLFAHFSYV